VRFFGGELSLRIRPDFDLDMAACTANSLRSVLTRRLRRDEPLSFEVRIEAALRHQIEQHRRDPLRLQYCAGVAVAHREILERLGGLIPAVIEPPTMMSPG
jgi:hypothetical protein